MGKKSPNSKRNMGQKNPNSKIHTSRILGHIITSLFNSWHLHMLYWVDEREKSFEIKFIHRSSSNWKEEDISLLKELDQLFGDRYKDQKNYEENCRRRAQSNLNNLCKRGLLTKKWEKKETKSIRITRYKITESGWKIRELNDSSPNQKHGPQENEQAVETQPEDTVCTVSPPSTPDYTNLHVVPVNCPVLIVVNTCFLDTSVNGGTSNRGKMNECCTNFSSTSNGNGWKTNYIYDNKLKKNTMYGNGFINENMYGIELSNNVVHLEGLLNSAPVCSPANREVQTQPEEIPNNCFPVTSINGGTSNRCEFSTNSSSTSHGNGWEMNNNYDNKYIKNTMYGNGFINENMYGIELSNNRVHLEGQLNSAPVCSKADQEAQTQPEEIPNNLFNYTPEGSLFGTNTWDCSFHEIPSAGNQNLCNNLHVHPEDTLPEIQCLPNAEIENFTGSPLRDNQMETFTPLFGDPYIPTAPSPSEMQPVSHLEREISAVSPLVGFDMEKFTETDFPDSPKWDDFSDLVKEMEQENGYGT